MRVQISTCFHPEHLISCFNDAICQCNCTRGFALITLMQRGLYNTHVLPYIPVSLIVQLAGMLIIYKILSLDTSLAGCLADSDSDLSDRLGVRLVTVKRYVAAESPPDVLSGCCSNFNK